MLRLAFLFLIPSLALAQGPPLDRNGQTISIEAYAPNVTRITLSMRAAEATKRPGYGFVAEPDAQGWTHAVTADGADTYKSARMTVTVAPAYKRDPTRKLPDTGSFSRARRRERILRWHCRMGPC